MRDYSISELRKITESYVKQISESFENPSYEEVKSAYDPYPYSDAATVKIVPTVTMMKVAYGIFNKELFNSALPPNLPLFVETEVSNTRYGSAGYRWSYNGGNPKIEATRICLNSKYRMTFHEWLEVILHECVHILEYVTHPEPFLAKHIDNRRYDSHGWWFLSHGKEFDELGFNVRKYCQAASGTYDINLSDEEVSKKYGKSKDNYLIARLVGIEDEHGGVDVKISRNFKKKLESIALEGKSINDDWWGSIRKIEYFTTENPFFINWKKISPRSIFSGFKYKLDDIAEKKYGPFKFESEFDVDEYIRENGMINSNESISMNEDIDEMDVEERNLISDEYARNVWNINGVVNVVKRDEDTVDVDIF